MHIALKAAALVAALALGGCGRTSATPGLAAVGASAGPVAQHFEITVDGKTMVLSPDNPTVSLVLAAVMHGATGLSLSAHDKANNLGFTLMVADSPIAPGDFPIGECGETGACTTRSKTAGLTTYPDGGVPDPASAVFAYDYPELGLKPAVLTLEKIDDVVWPGVGPAKRLRGTFKGGFARLERGADARVHVVGPVRQIEGRFDMYAALR